MARINKISSLYMIGKAAWNVYQILRRPSDEIITKRTAWRPPQWDAYGTDEEQMIYLAPNISEVQEVKKGTGKTKKATLVTVGYYFDAFLKEEHTSTVRVTEHPVQGGRLGAGGMSISDHAYNLPDTLTLEILVSDSVESIVSGQFTKDATKSVSAYNVLRSLKERRALVSVKTRLHYYTNMIIESLNTSDDYRTANNLRCTVILKQVMLAVVPTEYVTIDRIHAVSEVNLGPQIAQEPDNNASALVQLTGGG